LAIVRSHTGGKPKNVIGLNRYPNSVVLNTRSATTYVGGGKKMPGKG